MQTEIERESEMTKRLGHHDRRLDSQEKDIHSISLLTRSIENSVRVMVGVQQDDRVLQAENLITLKAMQKNMDMQSQTAHKLLEAKDIRISDCRVEYNNRLDSLDSFRTWMYRSVVVGIFITVFSIGITLAVNPKEVKYLESLKPAIEEAL